MSPLSILTLAHALFFPASPSAAGGGDALLEQTWFSGFQDPSACEAYRKRLRDPSGGVVSLREVNEVDPANPPAYQFFQINQNTFVLRQNKCLTYEAPFLYLLVGTKGQAMLIDSGATSDPASNPLVSVLRSLIKEKNLSISSLKILRSHSHGDHIAGESLFADWPTDKNGCHVADGFPAVCLVPDSYSALGFARGAEEGMKDFALGERALLALPCPGHAPDSMLYYDRGTRLLFTGDSFYPGFIFNGSSEAHGRCLARMVSFVRHNEVAELLGAHIERALDNSPIPYGSTYNENEHPLALDRATVFEMCQAHPVCAQSVTLTPAELGLLEKRGKSRPFTLQ